MFMAYNVVESIENLLFGTVKLMCAVESKIWIW